VVWPLGWAEMADEEDIARLRRVFDAFDRGDVEDLVGDLAHDVQFRQSEALPWGGARHGHDGMRSMLETLEEHVDGGWGDPDDILDAGDRLVVLGRLRGTARATGTDFETPFAQVWTLADGVPVACDVYLDTAAVLKALSG
jgi:ketosteroid isomerase-like protein